MCRPVATGVPPASSWFLGARRDGRAGVTLTADITSEAPQCERTDEYFVESAVTIWRNCAPRPERMRAVWAHAASHAFLGGSSVARTRRAQRTR